MAYGYRTLHATKIKNFVRLRALGLCLTLATKHQAAPLKRAQPKTVRKIREIRQVIETLKIVLAYRNPKRNPTSSSGKIAHTDGGIWADNDRGSPSDGTMIAREVESDDRPKTVLQQCVENETKKLENAESQKHLDQNAKRQEEKKQSAEEMMRKGICDPSYFGETFCNDFRQKLQETSDENAKLERDRREEQAINSAFARE